MRRINFLSKIIMKLSLTDFKCKINPFTLTVNSSFREIFLS